MFPQGGWSIGRINGIEIKLNPSLILVALLVTFSLAARILPRTVPGMPSGVYWFTGLLVSIIFIGSILWHELAHALVAMHYHIPVVQIVLHLFGGVAQIARDPERPGQEFWIAIAGPISSMSLAIGFGMLSILGNVAGAACGWLAIVNLTLALFNLLPGFPLDGGRVLRAILWQIGGSYRQATRQASRVGQVMAVLFLLIGFIEAFNRDTFNSLWFVLIAAFLYGTASMSYRMAKGASLPMTTPVRRVMRFNVPVIEPAMPLAILAWKYLDQARDQAFPVMDGDSLVGMITAIEVDRIPRLDWGKFKVEQTMLPREKLCVIAPEDNIQAALTALEAAGINHAPVFEADRFVGMLNRRDIVYRT
ncbi:MAG: site-2 protease family protein [Chloroflexota bacterium]